jgi:YHS domain-containing protein
VWFILFSLTLTVIADDKSKKAEATSEPAAKESRASIQDALSEFNSLVGGWRGVGQPSRNSNKGSWIESAEWVWEIKKEHVGLRYAVKNGKQLASGLLTWDPKSKDFVLEATLPDKSQRTYTGKLSGTKLTLQSPADPNGSVHQIVVTLKDEKRTLVLFQSRPKDQQQFTRVAEVGYTREGTRLAEEGGGGPECIVTGGKGSMSTVYKGKTYYFCCTGCRDAFLDDPDAIIAQAEEKAKKKKDAAAKKGK